MNRVIFVLGLATGFVLGARAGRARYERLRDAATATWRSRPVQEGVAAAQRGLDEATPRVSRRGRQLAEQAQASAEELASRLGQGAQDVSGAALEGARSLLDRLTTQADDLGHRVTHTAEELRRRSEEQLEELRAKSEEQLDEVRRRVEEEVERSRDAGAESLVWAGELRDDALVELETEDDEVLEPRRLEN